VAYLHLKSGSQLIRGVLPHKAEISGGSLGATSVIGACRAAAMAEGQGPCRGVMVLDAPFGVSVESGESGESKWDWVTLAARPSTRERVTALAIGAAALRILSNWRELGTSTTAGGSVKVAGGSRPSQRACTWSTSGRTSGCS
jgi:hypothetical protein